MDEFPDSDEEFDFIENHVEVLKKSKENVDRQNSQSHDLSSEKQAPKSSQETSSAARTNVPPLENDENSMIAEPAKKRTYEELLGDIGDIFGAEDFEYVPNVKDKRPRWDDTRAVIDLILQKRKKHRKEENGIKSSENSRSGKTFKDSVSETVPPWNFVVLTRPSDYKRIYVRVRSNAKKHSIQRNDDPASGLFGIPFSKMKSEAEEILLKNAERSNAPLAGKISKNSDDQLWVDKYRPRSYMELLTDESVNRACLRWLKLWDKVVFNREIIKRKKPTTQNFAMNKFVRKTEDEGVDSKGFPVQRIALLSGPPGLGKTTLAHLVAKHAGYNVVEVNASDDRGPEAFKDALLAATEMRSIMGTDPKPNCLILDEIDGASAASVDLLIKYVQGKLVPKGRKNKEAEKRNNDGCKRPVICICNEAYAPSLRPLRAMAFIIPVPKVNAIRLADRLAAIARKEKLKTDQGALLELAQRSGCDVRSCLCALQYMGEASANSNLSLGLKDTKRGLFDCWKDILQVPMTRRGLVPVRERIQIVMKAAHSGETERVAQGVFHNYPESCPPKMDVISKTLEWYQLYDKITTTVMTKQDWRVMPYANYAFVAWHFGFSNTQSAKLSYPYAAGEANQKLNKSVAMLTATKQTYGRDIETLALDIVPFLPELLSPKLRAVSGHLYSPNERADLTRLINVLLELGLSFVQTKSDERNFDYNLDPNLFEVAIFPDCKQRRTMPYAVKQIVAQELEIERLKRAVKVNGASRKNDGNDESWRKIRTETPKKNSSEEPATPNHLRQLTPMPVQPQNNKYRNFFENFVPIPNTRNQKSPGTSTRGEKTVHRFRQVLTKHGVWYKYKEGFSNSVRRDVKISDLL